MDNHQLSNCNFNILLKCILHLFSLNTWTTGHTDKQNFKQKTTSCPILSSIFFSNVFSFYFHWTHGQTDTLTKSTFNEKTTSCPIITSIFFQMYCVFILIGHMDNWTHRQRQLIMDNHQLSNHNFNIFLKYILFYFHWTHGQPDTQMNKISNGQKTVVQF